MKIERLLYEPGAVLDFYEQGLTALGGLCDRTWHDRLEVVAEHAAARLWNENGALHAGELLFAPADTSGARDVVKEVFPGCPLTFRLAEALRPTPLPLDRLVLAGEVQARPPETAVAEKLWRAQFPDTGRWRMLSAFKAAHHFSLLALARCEIQAIDQHWSLRRVGIALPYGGLDEHLAEHLGFAGPGTSSMEDIPWPTPAPDLWRTLLQRAFEADLQDELGAVRARQEKSLRRELDRIDEYFAAYEQELTARSRRSTRAGAELKTNERLAAAKAEHARRRQDQVHRHEIRVIPHLDALLFVAEPAWAASVELHRSHQQQTLEALYIPRARRWETATC